MKLDIIVSTSAYNQLIIKPRIFIILVFVHHIHIRQTNNYCFKQVNKTEIFSENGGDIRRARIDPVTSRCRSVFHQLQQNDFVVSCASSLGKVIFIIVCRCDIQKGCSINTCRVSVKIILYLHHHCEGHWKFLLAIYEELWTSKIPSGNSGEF